MTRKELEAKVEALEAEIKQLRQELLSLALRPATIVPVNVPYTMPTPYVAPMPYVSPNVPTIMCDVGRTTSGGSSGPLC